MDVFMYCLIALGYVVIAGGIMSTVCEVVREMEERG